MYGYIYLTTNNINKKQYIGQHKSAVLDESYLGSGLLITEAIKKYGRKNFTLEILEWCTTADELNKREIYWISKYNAVDNQNFYNISKGGKGTHEYNCLDNTKELLREQSLGQRHLHKGDNEIVININKGDSLDKYLSDGWETGYSESRDWSERNKKYSIYRNNMSEEEKTIYYSKISKTITGRKWMNNGVNEEQVDRDKCSSRQSEGWVFGRLYAKGKHK